jgi:hypothetical protein
MAASCMRRGGASQTRRLILLISVGWVPPDGRPSGACLTLGSSLLYQPRHAAEGYTPPGRRLFRCPWGNLFELNASAWCVLSRAVLVSRDDGHLFGHGPHESRQLTGHGDSDHMGVFAAGHKAPVPLTAPHVGLPTDVLDPCGVCVPSQWSVTTDLRGIPVGPGAFDQDAAGMGVTRFGHCPLPAVRTGGRF